jgi:hypothetical protein
MFSEFFSGEVLSEIAIQRIFEQEVYEVRKPGTCMANGCSCQCFKHTS